MNVSPGRRFMIDLLVGSLMADGGLESALNAAITAEIQVWVISFAVEVPLQVAGLVTSINTRVNVPSVVNCTAPTGMCPPWFCGVPLLFFTFTTLIPPFALLLSIVLKQMCLRGCYRIYNAHFVWYTNAILFHFCCR